jgi:hypothetical protein
MIAKQPFASIRRDLKIADGTLDLQRIVLAPGRTLRVIVADQKSGRPIVGARLRVREAPVYATTDGDGIALLQSVGGDAVEVEASADDYLAATTRFEAADKKPAVIRLAPAASITANVIRGDSKEPIGPGSVSIDLSGKKWIEQFGSDGRLKLKGLSGGTLKLEVRVPRLASRKLAAREIAAGEKADYGTIALETGLTISGTVIDAATSAPVQARIRMPRPNAAGPRFSLVMKDWIETTSDDEGHFQLSGLDAGDYRLLVDAAGYGPLLTDRLTAGSDSPETGVGVLRLSTGRRITVTCHPAKRCGSKAQLLLGDPNDDWAVLSAPVASGNSEIVRAPVGHHRLQLLERGEVVAEKEIVVRDDAPETAVDIALREVEISGEVVRGGRPVTSGAVQFTGRMQNSGVPIFIDRKLDSAVVASEIIGPVPRTLLVSVDEKGAFSTRDLAPGTYTVTYSGASGASPEREVTIPDAASFRLHIDMPATTLSGRIVDDKSKTPEWARIEVRSSAGVTSADMTPDGRFALDGAPSGPATIHAYNDSSEAEREVVIPADRETEVDLILAHKARKRVTLAALDASGAARAGAKLFLSCDGGMMTADADSSGSASFPLGGTNSACMAAALSPLDGWAFAGPFEPSDRDPVPIRFSARAVTLAIETQTPSGFGIAAANGFPLERAFPFIGWPSMATPERPVRLRGLPPGTYFVRLATGTSRSVIVDGTKDVTIGF